MHETMFCGVEMPILTVRHVTAYYYKTPVAFGEHRIMLRPRDDDDQQVLETKLEITPEPSQLTWTRDMFGNHVVRDPSGATAARHLGYRRTILP
jgi:transglutaminase-like putative cysteine protease